MVKKPTSYVEQMQILKSRNIKIEDEPFCLKTLKNLNYYRLTAYMLPYKIDDETYRDVSFEKIYNIYEFDRKLRGLLLTILEEIELVLRTRLSYYHAHTYGELGYRDELNFNQSHKHEEFLHEFDSLVLRNKDNPFVKKHIEKYESKFPIWVAVELFPFGMLSRFYADLPAKDKSMIAQNDYNIGYEQLESWLICFTILRNRCAHYMRLYYYRLNKWPNSLKKEKIKFSNTIFDYVHIMKYTYLNPDKWQSAFMGSLTALIDEYIDYIELVHIGFPHNWKSILLN